MGKVVQQAIRDEHTVSQTTPCWNSACLTDTQRRGLLVLGKRASATMQRRRPLGKEIALWETLYHVNCTLFLTHFVLRVSLVRRPCFYSEVSDILFTIYSQSIQVFIMRFWDDVNINIFCGSKYMITLGCRIANENFNHGWKINEKNSLSLTCLKLPWLCVFLLDCQRGFILLAKHSLSLNNFTPPITTILSVQCGFFPSHHFTLFVDGWVSRVYAVLVYSLWILS